MDDHTQHAFSGLDFSDKKLIYLGLLCLVKSNSGVGFANNDQGHLAYAIGRDGSFDYDQWGDSPECNKLFKLMQALSLELSAAELDNSSEISDYIFSWSDFCSLAYAALTKKPPSEQDAPSNGG